ncbi:serine/threonine-protein kinase [Argonema galeatum]|uniref:serine/threonine-protein kinase n=1 Tax=Argonema galeatum TaxID=2942762 RepID=UPI0020117A29|nr:serine/threonine-protein kinase [Argonema galeatum]MCL1466025.1 serine/threonine protein kinase [Argonema galeatum A003/A1]
MPRVVLKTEASHPMLGNLLEERYQIIQVLNAGTFGRSYIAEDILSPGRPKCVIKHIKPASNDANFLASVRRQFLSEADTLKRLGTNDRIPQLLTSFEDDRGFYLVQEFFQGQPLSALLPTSQRCGKRWKENQVIQLLQEVLSILEFVHTQGVIHCDIKPNNIIKRANDGKFSLIEFGALQPVRTPSVQQEQLDATFSLQPAGYVPPEQLAYQPHPNSDIYALGTIAIQALTGLSPAQLQADSNQTSWHQQVQVCDRLVSVLNQMVRSDYRVRYQTATEALQALQNAVGANRELEVPQNSLNAIALQTPDISLNSIGPDSETATQESDPIEDLAQNSFSESSPLEYLAFAIPETEVSDAIAIPDRTANLPKTPAKPDKSKPVSKARKKISPMMTAFGIGMAVNALVMLVGSFYISQPDPTQYKQVDRFIDQVQWEEGAKKVCQIPRICFWQKSDRPTVQQEKI